MAICTYGYNSELKILQIVISLPLEREGFFFYNEDMELLVKKVAKLLLKKRVKLAIAESCTGGLISHLLTNIPGSSKYFKLGIVAYHVQSKVSLLKIPKKLLKMKTAYSEEVACQMAKRVKKIASSDIGLGVTGIAGPKGGRKFNPAGTVYIAFISKKKCICKKFHFKGKREKIKKLTVNQALKILKEELQNA